MIELEVYTLKQQCLGRIMVPRNAVVKDVKTEIAKLHKHLYIERQSIRTEIKGKDQKDTQKVAHLNLELQNAFRIYVKDLGPQVSWRLVFFCEYIGPAILYYLFTFRPWVFYADTNESLSTTTIVAALCYVAHYVKRVLETALIHRFSHATMHLQNLFKNCIYYWGFTMYIAYHINHPLYTPPGYFNFLIGFTLFLFGEAGNLSIHLLLRDLRPPGTHIRKIPRPNKNPLTKLCDYVSCPNYTYEFVSWFGFAIMTSCFPAFLFSLIGLYQMSVWAISKHKAYNKEFLNYPRKRRAIIPFVL